MRVRLPFLLSTLVQLPRAWPSSPPGRFSFPSLLRVALAQAHNESQGTIHVKITLGTSVAFVASPGCAPISLSSFLYCFSLMLLIPLGACFLTGTTPIHRLRALRCRRMHYVRRTRQRAEDRHQSGAVMKDGTSINTLGELFCDGTGGTFIFQPEGSCIMLGSTGR